MNKIIIIVILGILVLVVVSGCFSSFENCRYYCFKDKYGCDMPDGISGDPKDCDNISNEIAKKLCFEECVKGVR